VTISELYEQKIKLMKPSSVRAKNNKRKISGKTVETKDKPDKAGEFMQKMSKLTVGKILIALGLCTQSTLKKYCEKNNLNKDQIYAEIFRTSTNLDKLLTSKFSKSIRDFYMLYM
jgi:hypothetical protein